MIVPGEGPQPARGMIVVEKPTRDGQHFDDNERRIVQTALRAHGMTLDNVYITALLKTPMYDIDGFPRPPLDIEFVEWMPIYAMEVMNTAPAAILAIGSHAARWACGFDNDIPTGSIIENVHVARRPGIDPHRWHNDITRWAEVVRDA